MTILETLHAMFLLQSGDLQILKQFNTFIQNHSDMNPYVESIRFSDL